MPNNLGHETPAEQRVTADGLEHLASEPVITLASQEEKTRIRERIDQLRREATREERT